jgi:hypothetical protein
VALAKQMWHDKRHHEILKLFYVSFAFEPPLEHVNARGQARPAGLPISGTAPRALSSPHA